MTKPFPLQTVLELMQSRADEATVRLGQLIASERNAKNKLEMLQQYRDEYAERFRQSAQNGLSQREWQNFQEFLNRLDDAIEAQHKAVAVQKENTAAGQKNWQLQRKKLQAFDTLSDRHHAGESLREMKREQKSQDEIASRIKAPLDEQ